MLPFKKNSSKLLALILLVLFSYVVLNQSKKITIVQLDQNSFEIQLDQSTGIIIQGVKVVGSWEFQPSTNSLVLRTNRQSVPANFNEFKLKTYYEELNKTSALTDEGSNFYIFDLKYPATEKAVIKGIKFMVVND